MYQKTFGHYDVVTVGETWGATPKIAQLYSKEERKELSMVFQFEQINLDKQNGKRKWDLKDLDPQELHRTFSKWQIELGGCGWNSLFWNNHDLPRIISRWGGRSRISNNQWKNASDIPPFYARYSLYLSRRRDRHDQLSSKEY